MSVCYLPNRFGESLPGAGLSLLFGLFIVTASVSQAVAQGTKADYDRSKQYRERTSGRVFRDQVEPHWIGEADTHFWYSIATGPQTRQYVLVDTAAGSRRPAMNHAALAKKLQTETGEPVNENQMDLQRLQFSLDLSRCHFLFGGESWTFTLPDGPLDRAAEESLSSQPKGIPASRRIERSRHGGDRVPIEFQNRLDQPLELYWVTSGGDHRSYGTIPAGGRLRQNTFDGHAWLLKNEQGDAVASYVATRSQSLAQIDSETPIPSPWRGRRDRARRSKRSISPDSHWRVTFEQNNVILVDTSTDQQSQVTEDGDQEDFYGGRVWWSPDSQHFVVMRTQRGQQREIHLINSAPKDSIHAELISLEYAKPGDRIDQDGPVLFSADNQWQPRHIDSAEFDNPFSLLDLQWHEDSNAFLFLDNQRGHQTLRVITVDAETAKPRVTVEELSETFICYSSKRFLHRMDATNELIWMSERSGWNHLYLLDGTTGDVKHAITSGQWVVRGVERVDEANRRVYVKVSGMDADQDPYHVHLIRVDLDGDNLVRLTSGDGTHRWKFSPHRKFLLDTYSRVDLPPVNELREVESGELVCLLEQANADSLYATPWQPPERFVAAGRDGETDIHGIIIRPTNFDPAQKYPVLEHIYAGPHSAFVPKEFGLHRSLYEMAELGFIVVKIDGMGTNHRSKAFHDICWQNLGDSGFPDRIAWIRAAAKTRPEMDLTRVGIWGGSAGGQSALRALIAHGDFYHAAVADCGCHDNRVDKIWWNEQWMGWPVGPHYAEQSNVTQAHRMQGNLLLIWGELDRNVDPASTVQVIDALIRADKDFDQLIVPGHGHGAAGHPYASRRQADFFVRNLWNSEPRRQ